MSEISKGGAQDLNAILTKLADENIRGQEYAGSHHNSAPVVDNRAIVVMMGTCDSLTEIFTRGSEGIMGRGIWIWVKAYLCTTGQLYKDTYTFSPTPGCSQDENSNERNNTSNNTSRKKKRIYVTLSKKAADRGIAYYANSKKKRDKAIRWTATVVFQYWRNYSWIKETKTIKRRNEQTGRPEQVTTTEYQPSNGVVFQVEQSQLREAKMKWKSKKENRGQKYVVEEKFLDDEGVMFVSFVYIDWLRKGREVF